MFTLAANDFPPDSIVIAGVFGVDQESGDCMLAERLKKILRTRTRPECPPGRIGLFVEGMQNRVLLFSRQAREFGDAREHLAHSGLQFRQTLAVRLLVVDVKGGQATIDEINDAGFGCPGSVVCRNNAGGDGPDLNRLLRSEKFKFWRRCSLPSVVRVRCSRQNWGPIRRNPRGAETCSCSQ